MAAPGGGFTSGSAKVDFGVCSPTSTDSCGATQWTAHEKTQSGTIHFNLPTLLGGSLEDIKAKVTCVVVVGNRAAVIGRLDEPKTVGAVTFRGILLLVVDNGEPSGAVPDQVDASPLVTVPPTCVASGATSPVRQGNVIVKAG